MCFTDLTFGPKVGQIDPKWYKFGDIFTESKCTESDLKISGFVPFGVANLTHFRPKSGDPGLVDHHKAGE